MTTAVAKAPKFKMFDVPIWWHHHGMKIRKVGINHANSPKNKTLLLESNAVKIKISPGSSPETWIVEYEITHSPSTWSKGQVWMASDHLKEAFWFTNTCNAHGQGMIDQFGGDTAHQGKYIRYASYLNIPGPGTGHDGDPNVSVKVDDDIQDGIQWLMNG